MYIFVNNFAVDEISNDPIYHPFNNLKENPIVPSTNLCGMSITVVFTLLKTKGKYMCDGIGIGKYMCDGIGIMTVSIYQFPPSSTYPKSSKFISMLKL